MDIKLKRVYLPAEPTDGFRILVDRLWPRGLKKEEVHVDLWSKDMGPTHELRHWFAHIPERFPEFAERYEAEVRANEDWAEFQRVVHSHDVVTLLFAAKDEQNNNAVVLARLLQG